MNENGLFNEIKSIMVPGASWTDIFDRLDEIKPSKHEREIEKVQIYSGVITGPDFHFFSRRPNHENFPIYKCPKCKRLLKKEAVAGHMRRHSTLNGAIHPSPSLPSMTSSLPNPKIKPPPPSSSACASTASSSSACSASPSTSNHSDHPSSSSPTDNSNSSDILEQESLLKLKVRLQGQKQKRAARSRETSFTDSHPPASSSAIVEPPVVLPPRPPSPQAIPRPTSSTHTSTQSSSSSSSVPPPPQESRSPRTAKMLGCYLIASTSSSRAKSRSPGPIRVKPVPLPVPNLELKDPVRSKKLEKFIRRTRNSSMRSLLDIEEVDLIKEPRRHFRVEPKIDPFDEMIERKSPTFRMNQINQEQSEKFPMRNRFFDRPPIAEKVEKANRMPEIPQQCQLEMQKPSMSQNSSPMHPVDLGPAVKRRREMSEDEMIDVTTNSPINEHFEEKLVQIVTVDDDEEDEGNRGNAAQRGNEDDDGENRRPHSSQGIMKEQNLSRHPSRIPTPAMPIQESVPAAQQQPIIHTFRSKAEFKEIPKKEKKETSNVSTSRIITDISPNIDDGNSMDSNHTEPMYSERPCEEKREGSAPILEKPENEEKEEATSSSGPIDDVDDGPPVLFPQIDTFAFEDGDFDLSGIILTPFDAPSTSSSISSTQHSRPLPKILPQPLHQSPLTQTFHSFAQPSTSFQLVHPGIQHASHLSQTGQSPQLLARPMTAHPQLPSSSINTPQQPQVPVIAVSPNGQSRKIYFQQPQLPRSTSVVLVHPPSASIYSQQQFQVVAREQEWVNAGLPSNGMAPLAQAAVAPSLQGPTAYPYTTRPNTSVAFTADIRVIGADGTEYRYASQPVRPRMTNYIALQSPHLVHLQPGHAAGPSQLGHAPHSNQPQLMQPVQQILQPTPQHVQIEPAPSPYLFIRSHDAFPHQYPGEGWEQAFEPHPHAVPIDIRPQQVYAVHMPTPRVTETSRIRPE